MDAEEFLEWRREWHHSRRYWQWLVTAVLLVGCGAAWLLVGLPRVAGGLAVAAGGLSAAALYANQWSLDHLGLSVGEIRPARLTYLVPAATLIVGVMAIVLAAGTHSAFQVAGLGLTSVSGPLALAIAVRRAMTLTDEHEGKDEHDEPVHIE